MLFTAIAPVFLIIAAGFVFRRNGALTADADSSLLRLGVNLLYPCLILNTILGNEALKQPVNVWMPPLTGLFMVGAGYLVCFFGARALRIPRGSDTRTFVYVTGLYNYGYIAIPVVEKLFGAKAVGVLFTHNLGVEVGFWLGATLILAGEAKQNKMTLMRRIASPPVIAILISLILNFTHVGAYIPAWFLGATRMIGSATIPIALILTGATLADYLKEARPNRSSAVMLAGASVLRLGVLPLGFLALARWLPCSLELKQVLVVQAAMPCAMLPVILTKHYGGNTRMAVQIIFGTTVLGILTIPYWVQIGIKLAGL
jgi:predicted permease